MTKNSALLRVVICDDEASAALELAAKVARVMPKADIATYNSGEELLSKCNDYDIVLLDIEMPKTDGMTVAKRLRREHTGIVIIFVTAIKDYVFEAFTVDAFRYLVKPVRGADLAEVLYAAEERRNELIKSALPPIHSGQLPAVESGHLLVTSGGQHITVAFDKIAYAEVYNRIVILHLSDGERIEYYGRMSDLEKLAGKDFFRCHRSYLVHFSYVVRYDALSITLTAGTAAMSKKKYPEFVRRYMEYLKK